MCIVVAVRDGCEPVFRMLQLMSENYDHAGKIEEQDQMYQNQREVIELYTPTANTNVIC